MPIPEPRVVAVSVPARAGSVHVLRAVTASVAAGMRIPYDGVEDLRLAVDEASGWLIGDATGDDTLTLRLEAREDRLEISVTTDAVRAEWPPSDVEATFAWRVLTALVDDVSLELDGTGRSIRLSKRTLEASDAR